MRSTAKAKRRILATDLGLRPTWAWKRWIRVLRLQDRSRLSAPIERYDATVFALYAELCGEALARAHAKAGQAATIAGYLGKSGAFDEAVTEYAAGYADQAERDYEAFRTAARNGLIQTEASGSLTETMIH